MLPHVTLLSLFLPAAPKLPPARFGAVSLRGKAVAPGFIRSPRVSLPEGGQQCGAAGCVRFFRAGRCGV